MERYIVEKNHIMLDTPCYGERCNFLLNSSPKGSAFQFNLLYGALLGDAYLYPKKGIVQIEQGIKHKNYLFWLYKEVKSLTTETGPKLVTRWDKRSGQETRSYRFYTRAFFHNWRAEFYNPDGLKRLPNNFENHIDPVSLAVWFLDDGAKSTSVKRGIFYTLDNYSQYDIELFQHTLHSRFPINSSIHRSGQSSSGRIQKRLAITGKYQRAFHKLLQPVYSCIPESVFQCMKKFPEL